MFTNMFTKVYKGLQRFTQLFVNLCKLMCAIGCLASAEQVWGRAVGPSRLAKVLPRSRPQFFFV